MNSQEPGQAGVAVELGREKRIKAEIEIIFREQSSAEQEAEIRFIRGVPL